ncbi:MAG: 23S rRNA (adenine(2503)-C(2))-methyltransferase RlmN [Lachnospiraceae bacterium]|nr:23S rRNA (adenine(2503)-C(2))-methyltransferase RlmN [Lachnospiraceae bacterium]
MQDIKSYTITELSTYITSLGEPAFRAKQLYQWMHGKCVASLDDMTNIPKALKEKLRGESETDTPGAVDITTIIPVDIRESRDGTRKYLFKLPDGALIESVLMRYKYGNTVCVSSQVGCRMGCRFCASTMDGLTRNLTPAEMLDQIYRITNDIKERISHVVVMGMGEPMDNYDTLITFLQILTSEEGYNLSRRNITVSTCGLTERIREFADAGTGVTLAISLHAPNDEIRKTMMPIAERYSIAEITEAAKYYFDKTGRRITYEYALARDVNDSDKCVHELADLCKRTGAHVNLIPVNPVTGRGYAPTADDGVRAFKNKLEKQGINVTIRRELGQDIDGACGQLRKRYLGDKV